MKSISKKNSTVTTGFDQFENFEIRPAQQSIVKGGDDAIVEEIIVQ